MDCERTTHRVYGVVIPNSKTFCALIGIQYLLAELYRWMNTSIGNIVTINDRKSMHGAMRPQVSHATHIHQHAKRALFGTHHPRQAQNSRRTTCHRCVQISLPRNGTEIARRLTWVRSRRSTHGTQRGHSQGRRSTRHRHARAQT